MYRNPLILAYAAKYPCQHCGADDGTIVAAHSNQLMHGKGMGIKAHDCFVAYLCFACHNFVDGRSHPNALQSLREQVWNRAHHNTIQLLINRTQLLTPEAMELLHRHGSI